MLKEDSCLVYREGKFQAAVFAYKKYRKMAVMAYIANYGEFSKFR